MGNVMVDLETLGTGHLPVILQIGAVKFDWVQGATAEFNRTISLRDSIDAGFNVDARTLKFWFEQPVPVQKAVGLHDSGHQSQNLRRALLEFSEFVKDQTLWSLGSNFDLRILREAYDHVAGHCPWHFTKERDMRTAVQMARQIGEFKDWHKTRQQERTESTRHEALADAHHQVGVLIGAFKVLRLV